MEIGNPNYVGKIIQVSDVGVSYLVQLDTTGKEMGSMFSFTLGVIEGYRDEYPRELKQFGFAGLRPGLKVFFEADGQGRVRKILPYKLKK